MLEPMQSDMPFFKSYKTNNHDGTVFVHLKTEGKYTFDVDSEVFKTSIEITLDVDSSIETLE
jgi:hypothetical protein